MRQLSLDVPKDDRPFYLRLADAVRTAIRAGQARPGEALPSTRALAAETGHHRHTVMTALDELVAEGWLVARRGAAYRVVSTLPDTYFRASAPIKVKETSPPPVPPPSTRVPDIAFASGMPDLRLFPYDQLRNLYSDVLRHNARAATDRGDPAGYGPFVTELATYLRRVRALQPARLVVTHGSQEALFLAGHLIASRGDTIAVEERGYPPAWDALRNSGAALAPLPMDDEGVDPDGLAKLCKRRRVKLVYLTPLHQYPTTVTLSAPRRLALYEVACRHGVALLEDDYDHEFHYRSHPTAPLASNDPAGIVLYASTFSKVLYPSARLGYLGVPEALGDPLRALKRIVSRQCDGLLQAAVARWMREGGFERHLRRMRREYERRLIALDGALEEARRRVPELAWRVPDGGMALWLDTPWDSRAARDAAARAGVFVHAGADFMLSPRPDTHLRLGFASLTPDEIRRGVALFVSAARSSGRSRRR